MKQPDSFIKMVNKAVGNPPNGPARMGITNIGAAKLLYREHRAVVRMVKRVKATAPLHKGVSPTEPMVVAYRIACSDILAALDRRVR